MKRLFAMLFLVVIVLAGMVYAEDQSASTTDTPAAAPGVASPAPAADGADSTAEQPQEKPVVKKERSRTGYGLTVGIYNPIDSTVRDTFGETWVRYGLRPIPVELANRWRPGFDLSYYAMSHEDDEVTIIPLTAGFVRGFGKSDGNERKTQSYLALNAGPYYCDLDVPSLARSKSGWGLNANVTYGVVFRNRWSLEARYETMSKFAGFDFSAFTVSASMKLFTARL